MGEAALQGLLFTSLGIAGSAFPAHYGMRVLLYCAIGVFVVAWVGQFIGHIYEGHRPSFFTDLVFLLVGPMWTLRKLYQRLGLGY